MTLRYNPSSLYASWPTLRGYGKIWQKIFFSLSVYFLYSFYIRIYIYFNIFLILSYISNEYLANVSVNLPSR